MRKVKGLRFLSSTFQSSTGFRRRLFPFVHQTISYWINTKVLILTQSDFRRSTETHGLQLLSLRPSHAEARQFSYRARWLSPASGRRFQSAGSKLNFHLQCNCSLDFPSWPWLTTKFIKRKRKYYQTWTRQEKRKKEIKFAFRWEINFLSTWHKRDANESYITCCREKIIFPLLENQIISWEERVIFRSGRKSFLCSIFVNNKRKKNLVFRIKSNYISSFWCS